MQVRKTKPHDKEDLTIPGRCARTGVELNYANNPPNSRYYPRDRQRDIG